MCYENKPDVPDFFIMVYFHSSAMWWSYVKLTAVRMCGHEDMCFWILHSSPHLSDGWSEFLNSVDDLYMRSVLSQCQYTAVPDQSSAETLNKQRAQQSPLFTFQRNNNNDDDNNNSTPTRHWKLWVLQPRSAHRTSLFIFSKNTTRRFIFCIIQRWIYKKLSPFISLYHSCNIFFNQKEQKRMTTSY